MARKDHQPTDSNYKIITQVDESLRDNKDAQRTEERDGGGGKWEPRYRGFPWLSVVVMMNLSLWISMLYAVLKINDYAIRRQYYNTTWWLIFIIPLLAFMFLLLSPCRNYLKKIRTDFPNHWRLPNYGRTIDMISGLCCFTLVIVYLYASAIPQYNTAQWETRVDFNLSITLPAVAVLQFPRIPGYSAFSNTNSTCSYSIPGIAGVDCPEQAFESKPSTLNFSSDPNLAYEAYIFNGTVLPQRGNTPPDYVTLSIAKNYSRVNDKENGQTMTIVLFDPRVDLRNAMACDLVLQIGIAPAVDNLVYYTAEGIMDTLGMIRPPAEFAQHCAEFYKTTLSQDPPYLNYRASVNTRTYFDYNECVRRDLTCISSVTIGSANAAINTMTSRHGTTILNIWLNAGAIVGAVQFFGWLIAHFR